MSYELLWKAIIRPPRDGYLIEDLGDELFVMGKKHYKRTDFELRSVQNYKIVGSHYEPIDSERISPILPCVIFLHGNSSSRLEATNVLFLLTGYITVVSIDFPGCGLSEGEYISLGFFEKFDLANLIDYVRNERRVGKIAIWGRSMGAATAILYAHENKQTQIEALILDSPFADLKQVSLHLVKSKSKMIPNFVFNLAYKFIASSIKTRANFDINTLKPAKCVKKIKIPAYFVYSFQDELIPYEQFEQLLSDYGGPKEYEIVEGGHNEHRNMELYQKIGLYLCDHLKIKDLLENPIFIPPHLIDDEIVNKAKEYERNNDDQVENLIKTRVTQAASYYYRTIPRN